MRDSLRRKFSLLYNHKKPTGDPSCPVCVCCAKQIWERIKQEMDISDGEPGTEYVDSEQGADIDGSKDEIVSNVGDVAEDVTEEMEVAGSRESIGRVSEMSARDAASGASVAARGSGLLLVGA